MNLSDARSPAPAIIAGTGNPVAGSMMVSDVVVPGPATGISRSVIMPPAPCFYMGHYFRERGPIAIRSIRDRNDHAGDTGIVKHGRRTRVGTTISGPFRSVQGSGRRGVGELLNGGGDPAPGVSTVVIAFRREALRLYAIGTRHRNGVAATAQLTISALGRTSRYRGEGRKVRNRRY